MVLITLPDGSSRSYEKEITGLEIASSISPRLAKEAIVVRVNGDLWDLNRSITEDATIEIVTRQQPEALEVLRHDAAHLLAEAIKELYPEAQITIGPAIDNGFYYDIYREESFTLADLEKLEKRMAEIVDRDEAIQRQVWQRDEAISYFKSMGEHFKAEIIADLPQTEKVTLYKQGSFLDLCRGPHLPSTARIGKAFKLMKLAGAYWRGDHRNPMLQRIYGTAWATEQQLKDYLHQLEEAEKRDHRKLGREMDLFHLQEESPGAIFWHPKGWEIYQTLQNYIRRLLKTNDYVEVNTPIMVDRSLWEASGHWSKFRENMFTSNDDETKVMAVKPMNCPCHIQIFRQGIKSYRDLPLRMAEFGACHRNEPSGSLHGIMRVRAFVQDDAHIFCTPQQITAETKAFCQLLQRVYKDLGFEHISIKFSDRPENRAGSDEVWDQAEQALREAALETGLEFILNPGEGAFYGPKLEFCLRDAIGREWQCGTFQVDFVLPQRLEAYYVGEDGQKHHPVMLHRAILGSLERFIGVLIEHFAGKFPLWLAPTQIAIAPITDESHEYAQEISNLLKTHGLRVETDLRNEKINYKIRELSLAKVPYIFVVGKREAQERTVAIRRLGGEMQEILALEDAIAKLREETLPPA
ncbi:MAG: threonine--tRNA ligase [Candidatus Paracaedimonas acanthamoebae]|uniref:Threonine--tRNA ligase n=1 Tax=Candidatus Paracaedimonas acanthamoebae TaxID=244581 RepID=A0A8J7PXK1_9PROT|nr:threonine--tRNA ligase [Candidatus Paracaedimonas acanthamoebae]